MAEDVMNPHITKAQRTLNVMDCYDLIDSSKTKNLIIVDEKGGFCGTLSQQDIENSKQNQYFQDFVSHSVAKEYQPSLTGINRIF